MNKEIEVSICIITYDRQDYLTNLLNALKLQTFSNFEIIIVEAGNFEKTKSIINKFSYLDINIFRQIRKGLVNARNEAWKKAKGNIVCFIDDDIIPEHFWLEKIMDTFYEYKDAGGVGGPTIMPKELWNSRNTTSLLLDNNSLFKKMIKAIYFKFFLEDNQLSINNVSKSGAFSLGSIIPEIAKSLDHIIEVKVLDPCHMCFRKEVLIELGGLDTIFTGAGDHNEPDLCFRARKKGHRLLFNSKAIVYHYPSKRGVYKGSRAFHYQRGKNFSLFSRRHIGISLPNILYIILLSIYCFSKFISEEDLNWIEEIKGLINGYCRYRKYENY